MRSIVALPWFLLRLCSYAGAGWARAAGSRLRLQPRKRLLKPTAYREQPASCAAGLDPLAHNLA